MRSSLEICDVAAGSIETIYQTDDLIEAPNWAPSDDSLVFNGDGRLFRIELGPGAEPQPINTGFAVQCNNDHGISPDGTKLVISDKTEAGESCIYTLPAAGGAPERVTANTPSYWHGWSPDGATLAYCARRDGVFDIYSIGVEGGAETCLTDGKGHSDGPDYTPDGEWIWFNSSRSGAMALWRMHPDGGALQQMTSGERVDWFPHPSPDGRKLVYLSYAPGTEGHPRDRDVELRMLPIGGGAPRTLFSLFGGQGTINVSSWSPDGRRFAFVRYARPQHH